MVQEYKKKLIEAGLKVTPQRLAVLKAIYTLKNHPTAENILDFVHESHPGIATGTVYKVLDVLVDKEIVRKVRTEKDIMRYEGNTNHHHHLYCSSCDLIEDYQDPELDKLLQEYFSTKKISGFTIEEIKVEVKGKFKKC